MVNRVQVNKRSKQRRGIGADQIQSSTNIRNVNPGWSRGIQRLDHLGRRGAGGAGALAQVDGTSRAITEDDVREADWSVPAAVHGVAGDQRIERHVALRIADI